MTTGAERRRAQRYLTSLPVRTPNKGVGKVFGVTRDVSSGGLFFYTEMEKWEAGNSIEFVFEFPPPIGAHAESALCRGTVVRAETEENVRGIAVRIDRISFLDSN
jgi:PilZ domain